MFYKCCLFFSFSSWAQLTYANAAEGGNAAFAFFIFSVLPTVRTRPSAAVGCKYPDDRARSLEYLFTILKKTDLAERRHIIQQNPYFMVISFAVFPSAAASFTLELPAAL